MNSSFILLLLGILYTLIFGGLSLLRREGLSTRFAVESIIITLVATGLNFFSLYPLQPIFFLIILYLFTMRIRLLVDVANSLAKRNQHENAHALYRFANHLFPDRTNLAIIQVNQAAAYLNQGNPQQAIDILNKVLQNENQSFLGLKHEAAAHYNLASAYRCLKMESKAIAEYNQVIDLLPASLYARRAEKALEKMKSKN